MSIKEKLNRVRKPKGGDLPGSSTAVEMPAASVPKPSTRFGGLVGKKTGDFSDFDAELAESAQLPPESDDDIPFDASPRSAPVAQPTKSQPQPTSPPSPRAIPPAQPSSNRFAGMAKPPARSNPSSASPERQETPAQQTPVKFIEWNDPVRPAGSSYLLEDWLAAEDGGANIVFEMVKEDEIGLVAIPKEGMNAVEALLYDRSLVVPEDIAFATSLPRHASIHHRDPVLGDRGLIKYKLVRTQSAIDKTPWLNGSILRNDVELAYQEAMAAKSEVRRFGNMQKR